MQRAVGSLWVISALFGAENVPVCLFGDGCQGPGETCFQLPLARMTDVKTIKSTTACVCVCVF